MFWKQRESALYDQRRIYSYERTWNRQPINAYLSIDRFRSGDDWVGIRDDLKEFVQSQLLKDVARYPVGQISLHAVWSAILPTVRPDYWISAGYRCQIERFDKTPIVRIPVCLPWSEDRIIERIGGPVGWAVDSIPSPQTLELSGRTKLIFTSTLLNSLSFEVRDLMSDRRV